MQRRKISKPLERAARAIKDSDEFVGHVAGVAERYRRELALEEGLRDADVRRSLKYFRKHAQALADWLRQASRANSHANKSGSEMRALSVMAPSLNRTPLRAETKDVLDWLMQADAAAERSLLQERPRPSTRQQGVAPRIAAEGLRATLEHHQLKVSTAGSKERPSAVVALLCAVAKSAGATLTPEDAKRAFAASRKKHEA